MRKSRNNTILSFTTVLVLSIVVGIIVWTPQFTKHLSEFYYWITNFLGLAITLLLGTSIFIKNREIRFLENETIFPFLFTLLFFGLVPNELALNKGYITLVCTSLAFYILIYQSDNFFGPWHCMESMLLLSAGSIFVPILWVFIPIFGIGQVIFNKKSFKCTLASIIGVFAPYLVGAGIIYVLDLNELIDTFFINVIETYTLDLPQTYLEWTIICIITLSTLIGIFSLFNQSSEKRYIHWINNFSAILLVFSLILNILFFNSNTNLNTAYWVSFLLTYYYSKSNNLFAKIYFWLLLIASLGIIIVNSSIL